MLDQILPEGLLLDSGAANEEIKSLRLLKLCVLFPVLLVRLSVLAMDLHVICRPTCC